MKVLDVVEQRYYENEMSLSQVFVPLFKYSGRALCFLPLPVGERCFRLIYCEENETFSRSNHENGVPIALIKEEDKI